MKRLFTLIFLLASGFYFLQAQSWYVYDGSVVPDVLDEWVASSNDPGPNFIETVVDDADVPGNKLFQYIQPDALRLDGTPKARKYYKYKFSNGEATKVTVVTRMKGIQIDSITSEVVMQLDYQVPWREVISPETDNKIIDMSKSGAEVSVDMDFTEWHIYRTTIDETGNVAVYLDENPTPIHTGVSSETTTENFVRFGDAGSARVAGYVDWFIVDSSGVYAPGEGASIPDSCSVATGSDVTIIPSGGDIQSYIDAAADGDVLSLASGGVYETGTLDWPKSLTLKAADGATVRPVVYQASTNAFKFGAEKSGAVVILDGIEFSSVDSRYFFRLATGDSLSKVIMNDLVVHGYDRCIIRASDAGIFIDSIIIENSYFYDFDGSDYRLFYLDKGDCPVKYFKAANSSFVDFDRTFLQINSPETVKEVIIDQCNIHGRSDARDDDLFDIDGGPGSTFTLSNTIISSILLKEWWDIRDNVTDEISNVYFHNIEFPDSVSTNVWSTEAATSFTDPMFSNAAAGALYLDPTSPALTASTTGGAIGDPRWVTAPAKASLLKLSVDAGMMESFASDVLSYDVEAPYGTTTVNVEAVPNFADATVVGDGAVDVSSGTGTATVVVTGGDASSTTYTINFTVALPSTDATLSELIPSVGTLAPVFDPAVNSYTLEVPNGTDTVFFDFTVADETATVVDSDTVILQPGGSTATFVVTAQDGTTELTYTVDISFIVGIENTVIDAVHMYYNYQSDQLILKNSTEVESVDIFSITGRKVATVKNFNNETMEISTANLINGIYIVRMKLSENGVQSSKFVK